MLKVALIGNPNTGKTSLFNELTGLNQKVGNYPGVTVDKKTGTSKLSDSVKAQIIDLPGTYSINSSSADEEVAIEVLTNKDNTYYPDAVVVVADIENLKRNLLLYTQVKELGLPTILAINMADQIEKKGISINIQELEKSLKTKIALISTKKSKGISDLKEILIDYQSVSLESCFNFKETLLAEAKTEKQKQHQETIQRYQFIKETLSKSYERDASKATDLRSKLDKILLHPIFGYVIFFVILFGIFQALFSWSEAPMDFIDGSFASLSEWFKEVLPSGLFTDLLSEGIIPGIGGVVIFIPQIAFLFLFLAVLEESGYMSRVVFLMDKIMRRFGLSGKGVVPLISGTACAIPAIMATRNIESWKERLLTILVTPFTTCAARLPVYAILISIIVPSSATYLGFNTQGLVLMGLYLLGFVSAIGASYILNKVIKLKSTSYFVIEMPNYQMPLVKNIGLTVLEKTKAFVFDAGKIILAISILLWVLASFGPSDEFSNAEEIVTNSNTNLSKEEIDVKVASYKLERSYIGVLGKGIEPVIEPLGYDWKIGIGLITSFAAREVFVGTMATIYSVGSEEELPVKEKMMKELRADRKTPIYSFATGISLLLFYAFAMQCMSTVAIVKRETNGWKWPLVQMGVMTVIAYMSALIAYQFLK
ncbi:ferrous iron transport protein B [Pseudofulvibacter geojedonensis]|uniref:Ferrous iron transport protein B n=1 Tax=Pseudofulvibacter geojedonensis TaxID=1123758 RepID=A0ABW3I2B7_9FLAO